MREYAAEHKLIADEFLEQLIVRRELAFNFARFSPSLDSLEALPDWAQATLAKARRRSHAIRFIPASSSSSAATHDALWNATQTRATHARRHSRLLSDVLGQEDSSSGRPLPKTRLATMIHLHDRYALDGRDPNTYTNILWCFGLHDRPWTERPIFGMIALHEPARACSARQTSTPTLRRESYETSSLREDRALSGAPSRSVYAPAATASPRFRCGLRRVPQSSRDATQSCTSRANPWPSGGQPRRKNAFVNSRVQGTRTLVAALRQQPPAVLISASAIGYYGSRGNEILTEDSPPAIGLLKPSRRRLGTGSAGG